MKYLSVTFLLVVATATGCIGPGGGGPERNVDYCRYVQDHEKEVKQQSASVRKPPQPQPVTANEITPANTQQMMDAFTRELDQEQAPR